MSLEKLSNQLTPCQKIPQDAGLQKLIGLYKQIQSDKWLQRVRIPGGRLTAEQWETLGNIAKAYTPQTPLHLTTRQDIELHNLSDVQIPQIQAELQRVGLSGFSAAGDTLRNITICPCAGLLADSVELFELAGAIDRSLREIEGIYSLPRKFKIDISCGNDCGQPWINDIGLVAITDNGQIGFAVTVAGSLGAKPSTGIKLFDWIPPHDVIPLTVAAVELFEKYGDRENRRKARLRHVRERLGNQEFIELLTKTFIATKSKKQWPDISITKPKTEFPACVALKFANGDIIPTAASELARLQKCEDIEVRIDVHHCVKVFGRNKSQLNETIKNCGVLAAISKKQAWVVACPGKRWCSHGLVHTNELANKLRKEVAERMREEEIICISGCPNGCSHPAVATIGLSGCMTKRDGKMVEAFNMFQGGKMGRSDKMGEAFSKKLTPREVLDKLTAD